MNRGSRREVNREVKVRQFSRCLLSGQTPFLTTRWSFVISRISPSFISILMFVSPPYFSFFHILLLITFGRCSSSFLFTKGHPSNCHTHPQELWSVACVFICTQTFKNTCEMHCNTLINFCSVQHLLLIFLNDLVSPRFVVNGAPGNLSLFSSLLTLFCERQWQPAVLFVLQSSTFYLAHLLYNFHLS